jgi:phosphate-selective porin OprO/OprP
MKPLSVTLKKILLTACLAGSFFPVNLGADQVAIHEQLPAIFSSIWKIPKLYVNKSNSYIQSFSLVGRYHGQYWSAESEENIADDWENRRFYLGFNAKLFKQFTLEAQISLNDDFDPVYESLYDAYIKWENFEKNFTISTGRLDYVYTGMERSTSSKKIKTMERALLVNQIMPGEVVGIYTTGNNDALSYQTGVFSGSIEDKFTSFEGGFGVLLGVGNEMPLFYKNGTIHLDYLYNNGDENNNAFKPYEHIVSLWHQGQKGPIGIDIDLTVASGVDDQSDVFGLTLLPTYDFVHNLIITDDKLQLALRYHYASSSDKHGLVFNKRYEQEVASGKGDSYNSYYLGLNYYIYQQKLKLMAGVEYFDMADVAYDDEINSIDSSRSIDGWEFITGVRLYF